MSVVRHIRCAELRKIPNEQPNSQMNMESDSFSKKYMLKILWKRGEIAPEEEFLLLSTIFCYLILDFSVKTRISSTRIRFSLRDKQLFEITEVEITRFDCILKLWMPVFCV